MYRHASYFWVCTIRFFSASRTWLLCHVMLHQKRLVAHSHSSVGPHYMLHNPCSATLHVCQLHLQQQQQQCDKLLVDSLAAAAAAAGAAPADSIGAKQLQHDDVASTQPAIAAAGHKRTARMGWCCFSASADM